MKSPLRTRKAAYGAPTEGLSLILLQEESIAEAVRMAEEAAVLETQPGQRPFAFGQAPDSERDLVKAIAELRKAAEVDPQSGTSLPALSTT